MYDQEFVQKLDTQIRITDTLRAKILSLEEDIKRLKYYNQLQGGMIAERDAKIRDINPLREQSRLHFKEIIIDNLETEIRCLRKKNSDQADMITYRDNVIGDLNIKLNVATSRIINLSADSIEISKICKRDR